MGEFYDEAEVDKWKHLIGPEGIAALHAAKAERGRERRKRKEDVQRLRDWHEGIEGLRLSVESLRAERDAHEAELADLQVAHNRSLGELAHERMRVKDAERAMHTVDDAQAVKRAACWLGIATQESDEMTGLQFLSYVRRICTALHYEEER